MWLRVARGEEEQCLIRVSQDDLFDVVRVPREPGQGACTRKDLDDTPFAFPDIHNADAITRSHDVRSPPLALQRSGHRGEQFASIRKLHGEKEAKGADHDPGHRLHICRWVRPVTPRHSDTLRSPTEPVARKTPHEGAGRRPRVVKTIWRCGLGGANATQTEQADAAM